MPWFVLNASNQVVGEKLKRSGVFQNVCDVFQVLCGAFKCYGVPSSGVRCLEMDAMQLATFGKIKILAVSGKIQKFVSYEF